jgi:hypothetical protein
VRHDGPTIPKRNVITNAAMIEMLAPERVASVRSLHNSHPDDRINTLSVSASPLLCRTKIDCTKGNYMNS